MAGLGDTFFFAVPKSHLWMVITTPSGADGTFIMVNVTTERGGGEGVCILDPNDYPSYIDRPSEVRYKDARQWKHTGPKGYDALLAAGSVIPQPPLPQATLAKVQDGCFGSVLFRHFDAVLPHLVNPLVADDIRWKIRRMAGIKV